MTLHFLALAQFFHDLLPVEGGRSIYGVINTLMGEALPVKLLYVSKRIQGGNVEYQIIVRQFSVVSSIKDCGGRYRPPFGQTARKLCGVLHHFVGRNKASLRLLYRHIFVQIFLNGLHPLLVERMVVL